MSSDISEVTATANVVAVSNLRGPVPREVRSSPADAAPVTPDVTQPATPEQVRDAVNVLNQHFSSYRADLRFKVEKDIGVLVVSVVDAKSGEVLMQIPTEQALKTARQIQRGHPGDNLVEAVA